MPFKSDAQRKWMFATHPKMARKWAAHTPKGKHLPRHVSDEDVDPRTGDGETPRQQSRDDGPLPSLWDIFGYEPGFDPGGRGSAGT